MREEIAFMESANRKLQNDKTIAPATSANPGLVPPLLRPEYATSSGVIGVDDAEINFYVSCKQDRLSEVVAYVERLQPANVVRQVTQLPFVPE